MTIFRTVIAFVIGLLLCAIIWIAVPYNNFALNNSFMSDGYLPEVVLFFLVSLVLVINPLLHRFLPKLTLSHRQLALITGMCLFGAVLPSNGLYRFFPHCLAHNTQQINRSPELSSAVEESGLPPSLFPDKIGCDVPTPVSDQLLDTLNPRESIPWRAWIPPLLSWGTIIAGFWLMMIGLGVSVYPQWRHRERLAFPLLQVYHSLIDEPDKGHTVPSLFRSKLFWASCGIILILRSFNGLNLFTDGAFPPFPFTADMGDAFTEGPWRWAPGFIKGPRFFFLFIGLAYFMSNRHSFSIWFTITFIGFIIMLMSAYMPNSTYISFYDQGCGAAIVIVLGVLWLGRNHYIGVFRSTFRRNTTEEGKTNALGGRLFTLGCIIMFGWFVWTGVPIPWALFLVSIGVAVMLLVARIVAEMGLTYVWIIPLTASRIIALLPEKWMTGATAFMAGANNVLANRISAVSAAVMMVLTLGLNKKATPKFNRRMAGVAMLVLILGGLVCGAVHLHMGYNHATSFDGMITPITGRGSTRMSLGHLTDFAREKDKPFPWTSLKFIAFGAALSAVMLFLCARFPGWPLHPIGLIFVYSSIGARLCNSMFAGWLLKVLIMRVGGARAYRGAKPIFLGFIMGEVFASILWTLVPLVQILFGVDPSDVHHMAIFQYT